MKVLYFDCFSGISGDMLLGALLDLGIDKEIFISELDKLNLAGYDISIEKKKVLGLTVTDVKVIINQDYNEFQKKIKEHEHHFINCHTTNSSKCNHHKHNLDDHNFRNLKNIENLIDSSDLNNNIKKFSKKVFREITEAEAKIYNKDINSIHFHEAAMIDSIISIVGVAICIDLLGVKKVYSSALHDGQGFINCKYGTIPIPLPTVMEMITKSKIPFIIDEVNTELVTPIGIGIIKCLAENFGSMPAMIIDRVGYGAGKKDIGRFNALRVVKGTLFEEDLLTQDKVLSIETSIDNKTSETLAYIMDKLLKEYTKDVILYTCI